MLPAEIFHPTLGLIILHPNNFATENFIRYAIRQIMAVP